MYIVVPAVTLAKTRLLSCFTSLALEGVHKRPGLYRVLTYSQGNLEAILYRKQAYTVTVYYVAQSSV